MNQTWNKELVGIAHNDQTKEARDLGTVLYVLLCYKYGECVNAWFSDEHIHTYRNASYDPATMTVNEDIMDDFSDVEFDVYMESDAVVLTKKANNKALTPFADRNDDDY